MEEKNFSTEKATGLTPDEAAVILGCSAYTVKKLVRMKLIPHYRIGRRIYFTREALTKWIHTNESRSTRIF